MKSHETFKFNIELTVYFDLLEQTSFDESSLPQLIEKLIHNEFREEMSTHSRTFDSPLLIKSIEFDDRFF